jgi:hypothetical protein
MDSPNPHPLEVNEDLFSGMYFIDLDISRSSHKNLNWFHLYFRNGLDISKDMLIFLGASSIIRNKQNNDILNLELMSIVDCIWSRVCKNHYLSILKPHSGLPDRRLTLPPPNSADLAMSPIWAPFNTISVFRRGIANKTLATGTLTNYVVWSRVCKLAYPLAWNAELGS